MSEDGSTRAEVGSAHGFALYILFTSYLGLEDWREGLGMVWMRPRPGGRGRVQTCTRTCTRSVDRVHGRVPGTRAWVPGYTPPCYPATTAHSCWLRAPPRGGALTCPPRHGRPHLTSSSVTSVTSDSVSLWTRLGLVLDSSNDTSRTATKGNPRETRGLPI